jgi:hypothetical protein
MLKPGGNVDSWCGKCNMMLAHTIEAMVGDKPARVHCNTCQAQHGYKPHKPGEAKGRKTRQRDGDAPAAAPRRTKGRANQYEKLLEGNNTQVKPYSPKETYSTGDVLEHPTFGLGVTTVLKEGAKMEVLFKDGPKLLVHGR